MTAFTDATTKSAAAVLTRQARALDQQVEELLKGRRVRITSRYNGQEVGTSRPPLTGRVFEVRSAFLDGDEVVLWLDGPPSYTNSVRLDEVEVLG